VSTIFHLKRTHLPVTADDYEVFDSNRRVVGRIMLHPQATKDLPWFLDDNGSRNPTISPQSRIFSDPRTGDGGF
jgi:hypothetical protein